MFERYAAQVDEWRDVHSGVDFINSRRQGEAEARALLDAAFGPGGGGVMSAEDFRAMCMAVNRECIEGSVPKRITCTRFGAGLASLLRLAPRMAELAPWLAGLWALPVAGNPDDVLAEAFRLHEARRVAGAGIFALTLLLYLKSGAAGIAGDVDDAAFFLPCTPALWRGLAFLKGQAVRDGAGPRTLSGYRRFLRDAHALRERFCLLPLEVDFALARAEAMRLAEHRGGVAAAGS
ncbi:hypothetical protein ACR4XJ_05555 [Nitratidesulfovibrio sp. D1]|uniref:hypothetical protein n=1 Tax=Nitratidesulfovibrio sp. D1 TaxID=3440151 RepID=UPI003EB6FCFD